MNHPMKHLMKNQPRLLPVPLSLLVPFLFLVPMLFTAGCGEESQPTRPADPAPVRIVISPPAGTLTGTGQILRLSATLYDAAGNTLTGIGITWSSNNAAVASVSNDGVVVARSAGTAQITAAAGGLRASITVTVARTPTRIVVTPVSARLTEQGETLRLVAVVLDADGAEITDAPRSWRSEHPMVASVDDQGVVTAHMKGETRITVTSGDLSSSVNVTVAIEIPTNRIVVSPDSVNMASIGETVQLSARALDSNDQEIPNPVLTWASEDEAVATVDGQGVVTAHMNGQTLVTVTWGELSASAMVTVAQAADRIVITPDVVRLTSIGEMVELTASVRDANDVEIEGADPTWTSEDPAVASVNDQGVVTAHMPGTTRVTATFGIVASSVSVSVSATSTDRELLIDFFHATGGPSWQNNTNWLTDEPLDQWHGIEVDSTGNVVSIWLNGNGLRGYIPANLGNLTHLEVLGLVDNHLTGKIPSELGNLPAMRRLLLQVNQLSGSIPSSLGDLTKLDTMDLHLNQLTGEIPTTLGKLTNLVYLHLGNNLLDGPIPSSIGQLDKLERIYLGQNRLTGEIPSEVGGLSRLIEIWAEGNILTGEVPGELGSLEHLISLDLRDNAGLRGTLPRTFLERDMEFLHLFGTQVCLPRDLAFREWRLSFHSIYVLDCEAGPDLIALERLYYDVGGQNWTNNDNWLSTKPMDEWFGVSIDTTGGVVAIELPGNGLSGMIPPALGGLSQLQRLDLGGNNLTGGIPGELGALQNLNELRLHDNPNLTGSLPGSLVDLDLTVLWLQGTMVCAPADPAVRSWLQRITERQVSDCASPPGEPGDPGDPGGPGDSGEPSDTGDREVLVALYNATDGPNWRRKDNWLSDLPLADWEGVTINSAGRVTSLDLYINGLDGNIPASLGRLALLERLELENNELSGSIPSEIGDLSSLQLLSLGDNELTGSIPVSLGNLTNLKWMYIYGNDMHGGIPSSIGRLSNLQRLALSDNGLDGGIPSSLGDLTELTWLNLQDNSFTGVIPSSIGDMSSLEELNLSRNDLTGGVPSSLGDLSALKILNLANNDLDGGLPSTLGNLSKLETLLLGNNSGLSGPLPRSLMNTNLKVLNADGTDLCAPQDAEFKSWLSGLSRRSVGFCELSNNDRETLVAFYNATDGPNWRFQTNWLSSLPISEWSGVGVDGEGRVNSLSLRTQGLSGDIPSVLADLSNLQNLYLAYNNLTGSIPTALGNLTGLRDLYLHRNEISGSIPSSLGRLENLVGLSLNDNALTGSIPTSLGDLENLEWLWLENNKLSGGIPASLGDLTALKGLYLQNNEAMSGPLPSALTGLTSLDELRLDGTELCVPQTDAFRTWLDGIETKQFNYCEAGN